MIKEKDILEIQKEIIDYISKKGILLLPSAYKKLFLKYAKRKGFKESDWLNIDKELAFEKLTSKASISKDKTMRDVYTKMEDSTDKLIIYLDDGKKEFDISIENIKQQNLINKKQEMNKDIETFMNKYSNLIEKIKEIKTNMKGIEEIIKHVDEISIQDPVTLFGNCKYFEMSFNGELYTLKRYKAPAAVALLRMKNIKQVYEKYGKSVGYTIIKALANIIHENIRSSDILSRCENGDFRIILHNTDMEKGEIFAQKIKYLLNRIVFQKNDERFKINVLYGVTQMKENDNIENVFMRIALKQ